MLLLAKGHAPSMARTTDVETAEKHALMSRFGVDIAEHANVQQELDRKRHAIEVLSLSRQALLHAEREETLLQQVCDFITELGGFRMAWVGYLDDSDNGRVRPVAFSGAELGYLSVVLLSWKDGTAADGPTARAIRERQSVIVSDIAGDPSFVWKSEAISRGYRSVVCLPLVASTALIGSLCVYSDTPEGFDAGEVRLLEELARDLSFGIETLRTRQRNAVLAERLARSNERFAHQLRELAAAMGRAIEARDPYLHGHQERTASIASAIASEMSVCEDVASSVEMAGLLHDVGKLSVPAEILNKPGRLSSTQFALMKEHCESGYRILKDVNFPWPVAEIVLQHHERLDGSGYPRGLSGDGILLATRILAVADALEAMTSHRPYRPALSLEEAFTELEGSPEKYDQEVVDAVEQVVMRGEVMRVAGAAQESPFEDVGRYSPT